MEATYKKEYGIVVALDFLGVRNLEFNKALPEWLQKRDFIIKGLIKKNQEEEIKFKKNCLEIYMSLNNTDAVPEAESRKYVLPERKIHTFQDNVVISFASEHVKDHPESIVYIRTILMIAFKSCLENGLMVRGAVSIGNFIHVPKSTTLVGPAVNEVMDFCEITDWAGVIFCPSCTEVIENLFKRNVIGVPRADLLTKRYMAMKNSFVKYQVPISEKTQSILKIKGVSCPDELYCLGWPYEFQDDEFKKFEIRFKRERNIRKNTSMMTGPTLKTIKKHLEAINRDRSKPSVENKYINTYAFAETILNKKYQIARFKS
ncbi:MAG TPA: hypothetical protein PLZ43_10560 [bacterium]|nr:hypothetical protein [bacterium]